MKCMTLANVLSGEQRSRFVAVCFADNTVRVNSLDLSVSWKFFCHIIFIYDKNLG